MAERLIRSNTDILSYTADGRIPIEQLYESLDTLHTEDGWRRDILFYHWASEPGHNRWSEVPIVFYRTIKTGRAVYVLTGVHGDEPAPPIALKQQLPVLRQLAAQGKAVVVCGLMNPFGYYRNWRFPNRQRDGKDRYGKSVADASAFLPHDDDPKRQSAVEAETEESVAIMRYLIGINSDYPPEFVLSLHETALDIPQQSIPNYEAAAVYSFSEGVAGRDDAFARFITQLLHANDMEIVPNGIPNSDQDDVVVFRGLVSQTEDGSVDHFLSAGVCLVDGVARSIHAAPRVIVAESPTHRRGTILLPNGHAHGHPPIEESGYVTIPFSQRVAVHEAIICAVPEYLRQLELGYL